MRLGSSAQCRSSSDDDGSARAAASAIRSVTASKSRYRSASGSASGRSGAAVTRSGSRRASIGRVGDPVGPPAGRRRRRQAVRAPRPTARTARRARAGTVRRARGCAPTPARWPSSAAKRVLPIPASPAIEHAAAARPDRRGGGARSRGRGRRTGCRAPIRARWEASMRAPHASGATPSATASARLARHDTRGPGGRSSVGSCSSIDCSMVTRSVLGRMPELLVEQRVQAAVRRGAPRPDGRCGTARA